MDIAAMSVVLSQSNIQQQAGLSVTKMARVSQGTVLIDNRMTLGDVG